MSRRSHRRKKHRKPRRAHLLSTRGLRQALYLMDRYEGFEFEAGVFRSPERARELLGLPPLPRSTWTPPQASSRNAGQAFRGTLQELPRQFLVARFLGWIRAVLSRLCARGSGRT